MWSRPVRPLASIRDGLRAVLRLFDLVGADVITDRIAATMNLVARETPRWPHGLAANNDPLIGAKDNPLQNEDL